MPYIYICINWLIMFNSIQNMFLENDPIECERYSMDLVSKWGYFRENGI